MDRQASVMAIIVGLALGCGAPGRSTGTRYALNSGELSAVDTSSLTTSERQQWLDVVSEVLSPCPELPMTLAQCIDDPEPFSFLHRVPMFRIQLSITCERT